MNWARLHGAWVVALLASVWMCFALRHFVVDDSYIPFRYIANWLGGDGIVWNEGERVEGYTSFLMLALTAFMHTLGTNLLLGARLIGIIALYGLCLLMVYAIRKRCHSRLREPLQASAVILLVTNLPMLFWVESGLETALFSSLLAAAVMATLYAMHGGRGMAWAAGVLFGLSYLARPEGALFASVAILALSTQSLRSAVKTALPCALIIGVHMLWRHSYYGDWLPNTYYAKLTGDVSHARLLQGLSYIRPLFLSPPFLGFYAPFAILLALKDRARLRGNLMLLAMVGIYLAYVVSAGGDWMPTTRFLVPLMPLLVLMLLRAVLAHEVALSNWRYVHALPLLALVFSIMQLGRAHDPFYPRFPIYLNVIGNYMNEHFPPDSLVALNMAGVIPTVTPELRYLDMLGLNDHHIAHRRMKHSTSPVTPGHEKGDGAYVLARRPDYIILGDAMAGATIDQPRYVSEYEMQQSPAFAQNYTLHRVVLHFEHPDLPAEELPFLYYERNDHTATAP